MHLDLTFNLQPSTYNYNIQLSIKLQASALQ